MTDASTPPKPHPPALGPYRIDGTLGSGGMGTVYRGYDDTLGRPVALKVLSRTLAQDPESRSRFTREARAAAGIGHPNVVQVFQIGEADGQTYIAMELVEGSSLEDLIAARGRLAAEEAVELMLQVADGLEAAWKRGIVHRDVKPANIVVRPDGVAKIADFGLSKAQAGDKALTQTGMVMGTPRYMSPEQGEGKPLDFRSDVYSLGATLYHALVGSPPYEADTPVSVIVKHITSPVPSLHQVAPDLPASVGGLVQRMLQKSPEDRHRSYDELREHLRTTLRNLRDSSSGSATLAAPRVTSPATQFRGVTVTPAAAEVAPRSTSRRAVAVILLLLVAAFAIGRRIPLGGPAPPPRPEPRHASSPEPPQPAPTPAPGGMEAPATPPSEASAPTPSAAPPSPSPSAGEPALPAPDSPRHRAEEIAGAAARFVASGSAVEARERLAELDRCLDDRSCAGELRPTAHALTATLAAREGDERRAIAAFARAFRSSGDAQVKVLAPSGSGPAWQPALAIAGSELGRFKIDRDEARELVPDLSSAERQLAFARSTGEGERELLAVLFSRLAHERVVERFPGTPAAREASDAITVSLLAARDWSEATSHVEAVLAGLEAGGAPWQELNDQLVFLGSAAIAQGIPEKGRKSFERARHISIDPSDPVRVVRRDGAVESVPLDAFLKETLRSFLVHRPRKGEGPERPERPRMRRSPP